MVFDRLKNILKSEFNEKVDRLSDMLDGESESKAQERESYQERMDREYEAQKEASQRQKYAVNNQQLAKEKKHYQTLEVRQGAAFAEIKKAYRKMIKKYHPDLFHNDAEKLKVAQQITRQVNEAYVFFEEKHGK